MYVNFNFVLSNQHSFVKYSVFEYFLLGIYYGILLLLIIYNVLLYLNIRSKIYIFYILYLISGIFISLNEDGFGHQFIWPEYNNLNQIFSFYITTPLFVFAFLLYSTSFLELKSKLKLYYVLSWASYLVCFTVFIVNIYFPIIYVLRLVVPIPFLLIAIAAITQYYKGYKPARFFIIGSMLIFISIVFIQLRSLAIIMGSIFTVYIFNFSLIVESVFLSIALADKIRIFRVEKELLEKVALEEAKKNESLQIELNKELSEKQKIQESINKELEIKVDNRTLELKLKAIELETVNGKLQSLIEQTNKMNLKLDVDNWELKKNVKNELFHRIKGQELDASSFKSIFKDEVACFRFLDELKWHNGFNCSKCGNKTSKDIDHTFVRKCVKCNFPESATAGTILHSVKFALNDALYITYLIHIKNGDVRLETIADNANISVVSASKFRAKVLEKLNSLHAKHKHFTWEDVVL